jgi:hypothetical protein
LTPDLSHLHPEAFSNPLKVSLLRLKVVGLAGIVFFGGCSVGAYLGRQYWPILVFTIFVLMAILVLIYSGELLFDEEVLTHRAIAGTFCIRWEEVKTVEYSPMGTFVLYGEHKRFVIPSTAFWSGQYKEMAFQLFREKIEKAGITPKLSSSAEYKMHRNVRIHGKTG